MNRLSVSLFSLFPLPSSPLDQRPVNRLVESVKVLHVLHHKTRMLLFSCIIRGMARFVYLRGRGRGRGSGTAKETVSRF